MALLGLWLGAYANPTAERQQQTPPETLASETEHVEMGIVVKADAANAARGEIAAGDTLTNSLGMEFRRLPAGAFEMGGSAVPAYVASKFNLSIDGVNNEYPQHEVQIPRPFYLGIHEVTQRQYEAVMGDNVSRFQANDGSELPVERVSWHDAQEFCRRLGQLPPERQQARRYRLPTEAEWEYACRYRATDGFFACGDDLEVLAEHSWFKDNSLGRTHPVKSKAALPSGLFDMHGNVAEWCSDAYGRDYYAHSPRVEPTGPTGLHCVVRGGSFGSPAGRCRITHREHMPPATALSGVGFRVVVTFEEVDRRRP